MPFLLVGDSPLLLQDLQAYACLLQPQVAHISKMLLLSVAGLDVAQHALGWPECVYPCRASWQAAQASQPWPAWPQPS